MAHPRKLRTTFVGLTLLMLAVGFCWFFFTHEATPAGKTTSVVSAVAAQDSADKPLGISKASTNISNSPGGSTDAYANLLRSLHNAPNKHAVDGVSEALGPHDYSAAKVGLESSGLCAKLSDEYREFPDFEKLVADGSRPTTPVERRSFEYLKTRFQSYCDPSVDYHAQLSEAFQKIHSLDSDGTQDEQLIARLRALPKEERGKQGAFLTDVILRSESPDLLIDAGDLLIGSATWTFGLDQVRGTPLEEQLPNIQSVALRLAACDVVGTCDVGDSLSAMTACLEGGVCYPGITYRQALSDQTTPLQFAVAQVLALELLEQRRRLR